ncbi:gluconate 2-dehydrogenase subunit 3 family protein [Mesorhizobium sp. M7A.F.Ca.US.006.04.2.1]|nr:gluconate 2-dehydrogenase subunit 3 family protein [Mesorhizobium sp. M7A.F.Ca.US.005.03.1.1]RVA81915.1 gluconate 2-dehydrogenase subunit 3 family protein [Mesorhizobium sp. M7A.F.Ca.US.006.04.2.1]
MAISLSVRPPEEAAFVEAATERLIPEDDLGPGAKACGVPLFIDHQLAGAYGHAGGTCRDHGQRVKTHKAFDRA